MFDRYSIAATPQELANHYSVDVPGHYKKVYNAGPTHLLPVITHHHPEGLSFFYWGAIPQWTKNKNISEKLINVRLEALPNKPVLKKKMMRFRCLVPADRFYCWKKISKKSAVPYRFFPKDKELLAMAGLWEEFEDEQEETHHTFSIITAPSNRQVQNVNERMPFLLNKEMQKTWLDQNATESGLLDLFQVKPSIELESYTVSPRIGRLNLNEPTILLPTAPADQFGNLTLFD
ncbi:MAG TPA: SOS response-associated peptidase [Cyclobacteriaceae bacterium]|nr:SOS response-associated peptidase [Cyclobacteriaceae bacterium]